MQSPSPFSTPPIPPPYGTSRQSPSASALPTAPATPPWTPPDAIASLTYASTRADHWRCNFYFITHKPLVFLLTFFIGPLVSGVSLATAVAQDWESSGLPTWALLPVMYLLALGTLLLFIAIMLAVGISQRVPKNGPSRACTSSLTPQGWFEQMPEKRELLPWSSIKTVREHNGDVYMWVSVRSFYIPREAFNSREAAQQFVQTAQQLRGAA